MAVVGVLLLAFVASSAYAARPITGGGKAPSLLFSSRFTLCRANTLQFLIASGSVQTSPRGGCRHHPRAAAQRSARALRPSASGSSWAIL